jgi:hypothetical protein
MWETSNSLWAAVQSGTNLVYHAAGWLEGGLIASPEKFVMDCEVLQMIQRYMEPQVWATTKDDIAVDVMAEVGPDGHYFGVQHTQDRYTKAFYQPIVIGLAQLRSLADRRCGLDRRARAPDLQGDPARLSKNRRWTRAQGRTQGFRRPSQGRRRRADRLLIRFQGFSLFLNVRRPNMSADAMERTCTV